MLNRAKYFQQIAGSIDSGVRAISTHMGELNQKESIAQQNLAKSKITPEIGRIYGELIADPSLSPDEMAEAWDNQFENFKTFALDGVTNTKAQEAISQDVNTIFANAKANVITTSIQRKADNIKADTTVAIENIFNSYNPNQSVEQNMDRVKSVLGYVDGKLENPIFSEADTKRMIEAYTREAYVTEASLDIDVLLENDISEDGVTGYQAAYNRIEEGDFDNAETKDLKAYLESKNSEVKQIRKGNADAFNQAAYDNFMPSVIDGNYATVEDINEFYDKAPVPVDVEAERIEWIGLTVTNNVKNEVDTTMAAWNSGEEVDTETLTAEAKLIIGEENLAIMGDSVGDGASSGSGSGSGSGNTPTLPGITTSSPVALLDLKNMYYNPSISSEAIRAAVTAYSDVLKPSDISKYMNTATRDNLLQSEDFKTMSGTLKDMHNEYYSNKDNKNLNSDYVLAELEEAAWKAYVNDPDMDIKEFTANSRKLFDEAVVKDISTSMGKIEDLRNGGKSLQADLDGIDSWETFMDKYYNGTLNGYVDLEITSDYLVRGITEGTDIKDFVSYELWGVEYDAIKNDTVKRNIADINIGITASFPSTKKLFETEVASREDVGNYMSTVTNQGLVFIGDDGYAYRSRLQAGKGKGKGEVWEKSYIGPEYYVDGPSGASTGDLPNDIIWNKTNYSAQYQLNKNRVQLEDDRIKNEALDEQIKAADTFDRENPVEQPQSGLVIDLEQSWVEPVVSGYEKSILEMGSEWFNENIIKNVVDLWNTANWGQTKAEKLAKESAEQQKELTDLQRQQAEQDALFAPVYMDAENLSEEDKEILNDFLKSRDVGISE